MKGYLLPKRNIILFNEQITRTKLWDVKKVTQTNQGTHVQKQPNWETLKDEKDQISQEWYNAY